MVVVDDAGASHEIKLVLESLGEIHRIAERILTQIFVDTLISGLLKHIRTNVDAVDVFESLFCEILTDEAGSTGEVHDFDVVVPTIFSRKLANVVGDVLWVEPAHPQVHPLVIRCQVVEVHGSILFLVLVAHIVHVMMLLA